MFAAGKQNDVPTLTGNNADEGGASPQPTVTAEEFARQAKQRYGEAADEFLKLYPAATDEQAKAAQNDSARDIARTNLYLWTLNRAKTAKTKSFTYFWTHALPGPDAAKYGAFHTSEVPYVLNTPRPLGPPVHRRRSEDRRPAVVLLGQLRNHRGSERQGPAGVAGRRRIRAAG